MQEIEMLVFSFHGMPFRYLKEGDPYYCFCHKTARLVAEELKIEKEKYRLAFQSRFGREEWLKPYTEDILQKLGKSGFRELVVVPISFVSEHIETLQEIDIEYKEIAQKNGIVNFKRVPALDTLSLIHI